MKFFSPLVLAGLFASAIAAPVGNALSKRLVDVRFNAIPYAGLGINLRDLEANESQLNKRELIYVYLLVDAELSKRSEDYTLVIPSLTPASVISAPVRLTPTKAVACLFLCGSQFCAFLRLADNMAQGLEAQGVPQDQFSQYLSQALQVTDPETGNGYQLIPDSSSTSPGPDDIGAVSRAVQHEYVLMTAV
ncbi:hypothetical protein BU15DRAFT_64823 [Melanogaster broomeanus]|nr:hypothetical protein BU15DRAFT_64823 [Melanogaster broomeanus]